jgi:hypothetical protein
MLPKRKPPTIAPSWAADACARLRAAGGACMVLRNPPA